MEEFPAPKKIEQTFEELIEERAQKAISFIKHNYDYEINNFEYIKLRQIAKEVLERINTDRSITLKEWESMDPNEISLGSHSNTNPQWEIPALFFIREYGIGPSDIPHDGDKVTRDFKEHLKILREGKDGIIETL
jgi:hypothetical protein